MPSFFFTLSLNLFQVTRFITASFVLRLKSTFQSNRFKFNIPDLKVYSRVLLLHTQRENDSAAFRTRREKIYYNIILSYPSRAAKMVFLRKRVIDFNLGISRRIFVSFFFSLSLLILYNVLVSLSVITSGRNNAARATANAATATTTTTTATGRRDN